MKTSRFFPSMTVVIARSKIAVAPLALVFSQLATVQATIYLTADDFNGTNLFGTLDVATGHFTQITTTAPLFLTLTNGPNGRVYGADANSGNLYRINPGGSTMPFGSVTAPSAFYGLAYSRAGGNFFADNLDPNTVDLYSIAGNGNSSSFVGQLAGPNSGFFPTGNLVFGPDGKLYFNYSSDLNGGGANSTLDTVNTSTGALTAVGGGLGSDILALFSDGTTLYGIDAVATSEIAIYAINTSTGVATQISTLTGLPSGDFFVDAATFSTPESGATLQLFLLPLTALLVASWVRSPIVDMPWGCLTLAVACAKPSWRRRDSDF
jgi:hypothetical protein